MSMRVDSSSWISGALIVGDRGLGVLGSEVPSTGESGPGYLYNDLSLPADANKEVCGRITTWPTNGVLYAYEDSSFTYDGTTDSFWYQLYVDGVATGSPVEVSLNVGGANAAFAITTDSAIFSGSAHVSPRASFSITTGEATFSGSAASGVSAGFSIATDAAVFSGSVDGVAAVLTLTAADLNAIDALIVARLPDIAAAVGARTVEGALSQDATLRILLAALSGRSEGLGTALEKYKSLDGSKNRIAATFDAANNRQTVTLDGTP